MTENLDTLLGYLTGAIIYLPSGYIFLLIYSHITPNDFSTSFQDNFLKSIVAGYFLNTIYSLLPLSVAQGFAYHLRFILFSIIVAYILAQVTSSRIFKRLLRSIKINRHIERNIWCSISDKNYPLWADVYFRENNVCYQGMVVCFEDTSATPQIVLARFRKYRIVNGRISENDILVDYSSKYQHRVLLNTALADSIELYYNENSKVVIDVKKELEKEASHTTSKRALSTEDTPSQPNSTV